MVGFREVFEGGGERGSAGKGVDALTFGGGRRGE